MLAEAVPCLAMTKGSIVLQVRTALLSLLMDGRKQPSVLGKRTLCIYGITKMRHSEGHNTTDYLPSLVCKQCGQEEHLELCGPIVLH